MENTNTHQHPTQADKHKLDMKHRQPAPLTKKTTIFLKVMKLELTLETAVLFCASAQVQIHTHTFHCHTKSALTALSMNKIFRFFFPTLLLILPILQSPMCLSMDWSCHSGKQSLWSRKPAKAATLIPSLSLHSGVRCA